MLFAVLLQVHTKGLGSLCAQYSSRSTHETWQYPHELQRPDMVIGHSNTAPQVTSIFFKRNDTRPSRYTTAPFKDACQHLAIAAAKDTKWPGSSQAALQRVDKELGGSWVLAQCRNFVEGHELAGRPARTLVHVTLWGFEEDSSSSRRKLRKATDPYPDHKLTLFMNAEATQAMSLESHPFVHYAAYSLDANGWPTGKLCGVCWTPVHVTVGCRQVAGSLARLLHLLCCLYGTHTKACRFCMYYHGHMWPLPAVFVACGEYTRTRNAC